MVSPERNKDIFERLEKELDAANVEHVLFEGIRPNPTDINVMVCC